MNLSSLLAIVYFSRGFLSWMIGGVSSMTLAFHAAPNMHIPQIMKLILLRKPNDFFSLCLNFEFLASQP